MEENKPKRTGIREIPKYKVDERVKLGRNTYQIMFINEILGTYDIRMVMGFGILSWLHPDIDTVSTAAIDGYHSMRVTAMNSYTDDHNFNRVLEVNGEEAVIINRKNIKVLSRLYGKEVVVERLVKAFKDQLERKVLG